MADSEKSDLDALGLIAARSGTHVAFGDVITSPAVSNLKSQTTLNDVPTAGLRLDLLLTGGQPIDYMAPVRLGRVEAGSHSLLFTGNALSATPSAEQVDVSLNAMPELRESRVGEFATWRVPVPEHFHVLSRSAGLTDEQINIEGLDSLPRELFEIATPVRGIVVDTPVPVGGVRFLPSAVMEPALRALEVPEEFADPFTDADGAVLAFATAQRMLDAEEDGIAELDFVLSWLTARARYALTRWPDRTPRRYLRAAARALPQRGALVWVRGLATGRQWIRNRDPIAAESQLDLDPGRRAASQAPPRDLTLQERQALISLRRAAGASDQIQAVTALWEAIEFYVAGVSPPADFDDATLRSLRKRLPSGLAPRLRERVVMAVNRLNEPPLLTRLREATERDGVPLSDGEWQLLSALRRARNATTHGGGGTAVGPDDLRRGVSLVARLLLYRAQRTADGRP